jgi:hypothetical protein
VLLYGLDETEGVAGFGFDQIREGVGHASDVEGLTGLQEVVRQSVLFGRLATTVEQVDYQLVIALFDCEYRSLPAKCLLETYCARTKQYRHP